MRAMTNSQAVMPMPVEMGPLRRLYATVGFHPAMPWPVARAAVEVRAARLWRSPTLQEHACLSMEWVVGRTSRADEVEALARRWVFENLKRDEMTWRPWQATRFPVERAELFGEVIADGRGAIVSFFHHGQHAGMFGALARHGHWANVAVLPALLDELLPGYQARRRRAHIDMAKLGATVFPAKGAMDHMRDLLRSGELVGIASDLPGSVRVEMLGRQATAASGAARLAYELGVPLIPVTSHPRPGSTQSFRIGDPIEPRAHDGVESVQQAIFDAQADAVLEWPEGLMEPLERWRAVEPADADRFGIAPTLV
jgi:lauroyl/myristoyl acyltransferase